MTDSTEKNIDIQNDTEIIKKMEDEHMRLQRQVRVIQADRRHRNMGVHPQFRRQDLLMRSLKKEYINYLKDLKIARSGAHKKKDKVMTNDLERAILLRLKSEFDSEEGLTQMSQLDGLLFDNSKDTLKLRKQAIASQGELNERRSQSENRLTSTENKLETAMLRFNTVQHENNKIRKEIEHMLKDRTLFNLTWNKMMSALGKGKKYLTDLFESSTMAYDQRDEWCTKLKGLMEKGKMDQMLQVQEMRELQRAFDNETKIYNFLAKKGLIRVNKKQEEREEEEKRLRADEEKKQLDRHLEILEGIQNYMNDHDINKIEDFTKMENENFSYYKLLTEYCAQNVVLEKEVQKIQQDIVDRKEWNEMMQAKREAKLKLLRRELERKRSITEELRNQHEEKKQSIQNAMDKITEIFHMLGCSTEPYQNLLGDKGPSLNTLSLSLCLITDKIKAYLQTVYYYERVIQKKKDKSSSSRLKKYTIHFDTPVAFTPYPIRVLVPAETCSACVEARWLSRVVDKPEQPLDGEGAREALAQLCCSHAYRRSDRVHAAQDCRATHTRRMLSQTYTLQ